MIPAELLRKKRDGIEWTNKEMQFFIQGIVDSSINSAQAAAFLMAACTRGLSPREIGALTIAMADSGERYDFRTLGKTCIDKHSTGGVGDKLSLLLVPLVAACGIAVPMMSGRGLGHTGGTVDKLESVLGFRMDYERDDLLALLQQNSCFMTKQTPNVAPADGILYSLRDVTGTVESIGLLTSSILSKKLVEDLDGLVLDMKVGNGAFMETLDDARQLAESMLMVAREVGLAMTIVFTRMEEPLGRTVGNWMEMQESKEALRDYNNAAADIRELTEALAVCMLCLADKSLDTNTAILNIQKAWREGIAHDYFMRMITAQQGDWLASERRYSNVHHYILKAQRSGYISAFKTRGIGVAGIELGAGRKVQTDTIDYAAGFEFLKKVGDTVEEGEELVRIQASTSGRFEYVASLLQDCIEISVELAPPQALILDEWHS